MATLFDVAPWLGSLAWLFWRRQSSDAKGHRDNGWTHFATGHQANGIGAKGNQAMPRRRRLSTRSFPGGLTLEEWLTRPLLVRLDLIWRAQCDLLGSFRCCADKRCRRHRTCCGADPEACRQRLWSLKTVRPKTGWPKTGWPKTLRHEARLDRLKSL